ncbi:hypothetical protein STSO111631_10815 [Stackebrandtia soli]
MSADDADRHFGFRASFDGKAANDDMVLVVDGDLTVDELELDFFRLDRSLGVERPDEPAALGLIVDGSLTVSGCVSNWESDFGPFLWVRGDLRAANVGTGGSAILVDGSAVIDGALYGYYNHGWTRIRGDVTAEVVIVEEHLMRFHSGLTAELAVAENFLVVDHPDRVQVNQWAGRPLLPDDRPSDLGTRSRRAVSLLDESFWDLNRRAILVALTEGRSLLSRSEQAEAQEPVTDADRARAALVAAGITPHGRFHSGFVVSGGDGHIEVFHCEADDGFEDEEIDMPEELRRYTEALTGAGFGVDQDPNDVDVLRVVARD